MTTTSQFSAGGSRGDNLTVEGYEVEITRRGLWGFRWNAWEADDDSGLIVASGTSPQRDGAERDARRTLAAMRKEYKQPRLRGF